MFIQLGNKIKELQKTRGVTQAGSADVIGVSASAVSSYNFPRGCRLMVFS